LIIIARNVYIVVMYVGVEKEGIGTWFLILI